MDNKKYRLKPGFELREVAGEYLAVSSTSDLVVLNPVSAIIWRELESEKTIDELADKICEAFDISKDGATADIKEFVESLIAAGVLE